MKVEGNQPDKVPLFKAEKILSDEDAKIKGIGPSQLAQAAPHQAGPIRPEVAERAPLPEDGKVNKLAPSIISGAKSLDGLVELGRREYNYEVDARYACDQTTFESGLEALGTAVADSESFNIQAFLSGAPSANEKNDGVMETLQHHIEGLVQKIMDDKGISRDAAYGQVIGLLDRLDAAMIDLYRADGTAPKSTFGLRAATLLQAQKDGVPLHSWTVFTASGKPSPRSNELWNFLDRWQNWVPEAQGKFAKFVEAAKVRTEQMSSKYEENQVVLLKGGFGAGKTRLARQKFEEQANGATAPDKAKEVVRRSMPTVPHAIAHTEGSQVAYRLFDGVINDVSGTVVYDSSLSNPADIVDYVRKVKASKRFNSNLPATAAGQPKLVIYDVTRKDAARFLAVLRRDVGGEDPRVPLGHIRRGAVYDKMNRAGCMNVAMNEKALNVEYHFLSGDKTGWDTQLVAVMSHEKGIEVEEQYRDRLGLEGLKVSGDQVDLTLSKEQIEDDIEAVFDQPVKEIMLSLSAKENEGNEEVFGGRVIIDSEADVGEPKSVEDLYKAMTPKMQKAITQEEFEGAFEGVSNEQKAHLCEAAKDGMSYLDLPYRAAVNIHSKLQNDPWSS